MTEVISSQQLYFYINYLRKFSDEFAKTALKLIFFNSISYYNFIKTMRYNGGRTIEDVLGIIEEFIPFPLNEEGLNMFISGLLLPDEEKDAFQDKLVVRAKADFIYSLKDMRNNEQWDFIVNICDSIRRLKEREAVFV